MVHPRVLLMNHKRIEGFWLSEWSTRQSVVKMLRTFRAVAGLIRDGVLATEVGQTFGLDQIAEAAKLAEQPGRGGKVLLRVASS
jgi:NADPH:quinone reductase-like Zn-dependent oxidoreductase